MKERYGVYSNNQLVKKRAYRAWALNDLTILRLEDPTCKVVVYDYDKNKILYDSSRMINICR